jgi:hypothetical protein
MTWLALESWGGALILGRSCLYSVNWLDSMMHGDSPSARPSPQRSKWIQRRTGSISGFAGGGFKISRFKIEIGFVNCQDALRNLFQLSQAITNYYILFQRAPKGI